MNFNSQLHFLGITLKSTPRNADKLEKKNKDRNSHKEVLILSVVSNLVNALAHTHNQHDKETKTRRRFS